MAIYISCSLDLHLLCTTVFHGTSEMLSIDVFSPEGLFRSPNRSLRITSVYLLYTSHPPYCSITPDLVFSLLHYPHLIVGYFNLHHPLLDPLCSLSDRESTLSARYVDITLATPYHLLNTPGVYTCFPFDTFMRPLVLDMAFANSPLSPFVSSWDTPLPSTSPDHVRIVITLQLPALMVRPPTPHWALLDWPAVGEALTDFTFPLCLSRVIANTLMRWFDISSTHLTAILTSHATAKRPCPQLKPWWPPRLSALRREYHRFSKVSCLDPCPLNWSNMKCSRRSNFKAITSAKKTHWSDFMSTATPSIHLDSQIVRVWPPSPKAFGLTRCQ